MTSVYTVRTDFGSRSKKLSGVGKGVPDMYAFVIYFEIKKAKQIFSQQHKNNNKSHPSKN